MLVQMLTSYLDTGNHIKPELWRAHTDEISRHCGLFWVLFLRLVICDQTPFGMIMTLVAQVSALGALAYTLLA